jgi:diguanylate cyclase (GGDEF)-like protein
VATNVDQNSYSRLANSQPEDRRLSVLVVASDETDSHAIQEMMAAALPGRIQIEWVKGLAQAAQATKESDHDAVLMQLDTAGDNHSPQAIRAVNELLAEVPLIVCGTSDNVDFAVEALSLGAQDYVVLEKTDGGTLVRTILFAVERKRQEQRLHNLVHYDNLTQLPNRQLLLDRLTQAIAQATRQQTLVGLLLLDLDRFKLVNDTLGHEFGDKLLKDVSHRINACIRDSDTLARLGGDEFVVVLNGINGAQDAAKVANKIIDVLSKPIVIDGHEVFVTTSIGISLFPSDGMDKNALITNADVAMYRAKEEGRNHFQFYTFGMNATTVEQLTLENDLRRAIDASLGLRPWCAGNIPNLAWCRQPGSFRSPKKPV